MGHLTSSIKAELDPRLCDFEGETVKKIIQGRGLQTHIIFESHKALTLFPDHKAGMIGFHKEVVCACPHCEQEELLTVSTQGRIMGEELKFCMHCNGRFSASVDGDSILVEKSATPARRRRWNNV